MNKTTRSVVTVTRIEESEKMRPWCKRFFIFMISQGVQCRKTEMQRWNKAVMTQKLKSEKSKAALATCSFVVAATRQLPKLQGTAEKALSTVTATIKKYGAVLWFIVLEDKVYVIFNVFTLKQAAKLLKDVESRQAQSDVVKSLGSDISRANSRFKSNDLLGATFCPSDLLEIRNTVDEAEVSQQPPIESDVKVNSQPEEPYEGKIAPFSRNQTVEVFSKTSGQWVTANVVCVQEDNEGIFVTVKRIDGHELDYDIDNVRSVRVASMQREHMPMGLKNDTSEQMIRDNQHESFQQGDFETIETSNKQGRNYTDRVLPPDQMADAIAEPYQAQSPPISSTPIISDAEWFKRMETFHIFDKIRSVKTWLHGMLEENEPLPQMIAEELKEVSEMLQKYNH